MPYFDHFDRAHQENFCASLLLLVWDLVPPSKDSLGGLFATVAGLGEGAHLVGYTREVSMVGEEEGRHPRADLVLRYSCKGTHKVVLVEVKTHDGWSVQHVNAQATEQSKSILKSTGAQPDRVVVLAPERLSAAVEVDSTTWREVVDCLRTTQTEDSTAATLLSRVVAHVQRHVVREPDAGEASPHSVGAAIKTVAALDSLLRECAGDVGGSTQGARPYLPPGGRPYRNGDWVYQAIERKVTLDGSALWFGVYFYEEAPPGRDVSGPWLEVYAAQGNGVRASIPLGNEALTSSRLRTLRTQFRQDWDQRTKHHALGATT
jgi:hypothetical protein